MHGREAPRRCRCAAAAAKNILRVPKAGVGGSSSEMILIDSESQHASTTIIYCGNQAARARSAASCVGHLRLRRLFIRLAGISVAAAARVVL